jgi:hypothetical protein
VSSHERHAARALIERELLNRKDGVYWRVG